MGTKEMALKLLRNREPFGKAGLTVAVIALVMALAGGAYAAAKLNGTQKKEVEKIAKKFAGKPGAPGAPGAQGPAGPGGPQGSAGPKGATGAVGPAGAPGTSVTNTSLNVGNAHCLEGGAEFKVGAGSATFACNGEEGVEGPGGPTGPTGPEGSPWTDGGTLPPEETETGTWAIGQITGEAFVKTPISFPIPLSSGVAVHFLPGGSSPTASCPGGPADPQAAPGNLCVYETESSGFGLTFEFEVNPETGESFGVPAGKTGAVLVFAAEEFASGYGTWAVTAPAGS